MLVLLVLYERICVFLLLQAIGRLMHLSFFIKVYRVLTVNGKYTVSKKKTVKQRQRLLSFTLTLERMMIRSEK